MYIHTSCSTTLNTNSDVLATERIAVDRVNLEPNASRTIPSTPILPCDEAAIAVDSAGCCNNPGYLDGDVSQLIYLTR